MKKIASILILVFAFTLKGEAQKKRKEERPKLTVEQYSNLAVKKMTLALDLSEKQQEQIKPLISAQIASKKVVMQKIKEKITKKQRPTGDEIYAMKSKHLDNQITFKNKMKNILNKEQFEKFEKMKKGKEMKMMKKKKWKKKEKVSETKY
ncbi:MAG: protein CpxP [Porticoccaceae bacterium]|jgi:protein CpxP